MSCLFCKLQDIIQSTSMDDVNHMLAHLMNQGDKIMATVQEVKDAVAAEAAEVKVRIDELEAKIEELRNQAGDGVAISESDLDEVLAAVQNIFTPTAPVETDPASQG